MTPEDLDIVIGHILRNVTDLRLEQLLRGPDWGLTKAKARKTIARAHAAIDLQQERPKAWHRAVAGLVYATALENMNMRVALEAARDIRKIDGIGETTPVVLDGTPESVTAQLQSLIAGVISGSLHVNTLIGVMPSLRELMGHMAKTDTEEDLGEMDVGEMTIRDAVRHTLKMLRE
ncbi:MAG: hypothetical protein ACYTBJ_16305 [Planctomycetota bacterium]|jgi:hypothetical protein